MYKLNNYLFLKIDSFHCKRKDICDEYELGKKLFEVKYDDGTCRHRRPLEVYYKNPDGKIIADNRFGKQEYGIRVGELYLYSM